MGNKIYSIDSDHGTFQIEIEDNAPPGRAQIGRAKDVIDKLKVRFDDALSTLQVVGVSVASQVASMAKKPDEFSIEIGLKLTADAGVVVAKTGAEGHIKVVMKWKTQD